ncbi:MAG: hypothetical protein WC478_04670 [Candidatus Omnitrophota bacterium]|nr:hypothetical protein [Candidatus Omnitrophota bacterium]
MGRLLALSAVVLLSFSLFGCSGFKEHMKGFMGISTREIEAGRQTAVTRTVDYDYGTTYKMTLEALKYLGSYVYAGDMNKHMLAVYRSETDTTPVGVYFTAMSASATRIEVSSPSTFTKNEVARRIFAQFEKKEGTAQVPQKKVEASQEKIEVPQEKVEAARAVAPSQP